MHQIAGRILAIDFGKARIGLAISDPFNQYALPATVLPAHPSMEQSAQRIAQEVQKRAYKLSYIVLGLPVSCNGTEGIMAVWARKFVPYLEKAFEPIPIQLWDERLTSKLADNLLRETGMNRKQRSKVIDAMAAQQILQTHLDCKKMEEELKTQRESIESGNDLTINSTIF